MLAFELLFIITVITVALTVMWRIARTIPEFRAFLRLDEIKSDANLAQKISGVNEFKNEFDVEKIKKFTKKRATRKKESK